MAEDFEDPVKDSAPAKTEGIPIVYRKEDERIAYAIDNAGERIFLSRQQLDFVEAMIKSNNLECACYEAGIPVATGRRWLNTPRLKTYFEGRRTTALNAARLNWEYFDNLLLNVMEGKVGLTKEQAGALKVIYARLCKMMESAPQNTGIVPTTFVTKGESVISELEHKPDEEDTNSTG